MTYDLLSKRSLKPVSLSSDIVHNKRVICYLSTRCRLVQRSHNEVFCGTTVAIDESNFAGVNTIHSNKFSYEDFEWRVRVHDLES